MVRKNLGSDQSLEDSQCTSTKIRTEDREVPVEELDWPTDLGEDQDNSLEDDQQAGNDRPEHSSRLIRDCASLNIITIEHKLLCLCGVTTSLQSIKCIDSFDIVDHVNDTASKDQQKSYDAQNSSRVEAIEQVGLWGSHYNVFVVVKASMRWPSTKKLKGRKERRNERASGQQAREASKGV